MNITIKSRHVSLSSRARLAMQSRVKSSLESMDHYIRHVTITLEDVNGPKGGEDMTCKVKLSLLGLEPVFVSSLESNSQGAFHVALSSAVGVLKKRLARHNAIPRKAEVVANEESFEQ